VGSKPGYNRLDTGSSVMKRASMLPEPCEKKKRMEITRGSKIPIRQEQLR
jgi:hypothetical protein